MRQIFFILFILIFSSSLFIRCHQCKYPPCTNVCAGTIRLNDSTKAWIPYGIFSSLKFKNSNGFIAEFHNDGSLLDSSLIFQTKVIGYNCGDPGWDCYQYYNLQTSTFLFQSDSIPLTFQIKRTKNTYPASNSNPDKMHDLLEISMNYSEFIVNINNDTINPDYNHPSITEGLDSMNVGGKYYQQVYHTYFDNYYYSPAGPIGVYYSKQYGLLRFDLSNSEIWELQ